MEHPLVQLAQSTECKALSILGIRGDPGSRLHVVCSHDVVFVTQRPVELLRDGRVVVNYQNPGLHYGSVPAFRA